MADLQKRNPLYKNIKDYLLDHIHRQTWHSNDRLPTEAELAKQFDVSRFTAKKALNDLVDDGIVYRIQGRGTFVAGSDTPGHDEKQGTASHKLKPIALIMPGIQDMLESNIMAGIEDRLSVHGYQILFRSTKNQQELESRILRECIQLGVKGVIIFPVDGETYNEEILRMTLNKFPFVVIDRYLRGVDTNYVCSDNVGGAFSGTSHLIELGHRKILFFGISLLMISSKEDRVAGYKKALSKYNIVFDSRLCIHEMTEEYMHVYENSVNFYAFIKQIFRSFLMQHPDTTAVFAATWVIGTAVMETAAELGIRVPEQLSVLFFDDYMNSSLSRIPPSCVVQPEKQVGAEAAELLVSVIENPQQEKRKIFLPTQLILRNSTASPRDPHTVLDGQIAAMQVNR